MEDFQPLRFDVLDQEEKTDKKAIDRYRSDLGEYTWYQDHILTFMKQPLIRLAFVVLVVIFLIDVTNCLSVLRTDFTVLHEIDSGRVFIQKATAIMQMAITAMLMIGFLFLLLGAYRVKLPYIHKGLTIIESYLNIMMVLYGLSLILFGVSIFFSVFVYFFLALLLGLAFAGQFYVLHTFGLIKRFVSEVRADLMIEDKVRQSINHAKVRKRIIVVMILFLLVQAFRYTSGDQAISDANLLVNILSTRTFALSTVFVQSLFLILIVGIIGKYDGAFLRTTHIRNRYYK